MSPIGGLVSHVRLHGDTGGAGPVVCVAPAGHGRHPEHCPPLVGVGAGADEAAASHDALRHALALYAAAGWDAPNMRWASADELGDDAIPVEDLARVAPLELRDRIRWVEGFALDDGRPVWIPAMLVHIGLPVAVEAEAFWPASPAGLSVAADIGAAVVVGFLDCAARDALAVARTKNAALACIAEHGDVSVFDATTDVGVPAAIAQGKASYEVGIAAGTTLAEACDAAVFDLARRRTRRAFDAYPDEPAPDPAFDLVAEGEPVRGMRDVSIDVTKPELVARLRKLGLAGYAVDLTTDELGAIEMAAVRVVVPGLSPLPPGPGWVDHARLARVAP
ncbi:MAG: YcaO-like family protein [Acidimicrobiales bacterium]|nr:YcaO-like family protein [Acidimicrobiales bacterium]